MRSLCLPRGLTQLLPLNTIIITVLYAQFFQKNEQLNLSCILDMNPHWPTIVIMNQLQILL